MFGFVHVQDAEGKEHPRPRAAAPCLAEERAAQAPPKCRGGGACIPNTSPPQQPGPFLRPSGLDPSDSIVKMVFVKDILASH